MPDPVFLQGFRNNGSSVHGYFDLFAQQADEINTIGRYINARFNPADKAGRVNLSLRQLVFSYLRSFDPDIIPFTDAFNRSNTYLSYSPGVSSNCRNSACCGCASFFVCIV